MPVGGGHYRSHRRKQTTVGRTIRIPCGKAVIELPAGMTGDEMGFSEADWTLSQFPEGPTGRTLTQGPGRCAQRI